MVENNDVSIQINAREGAGFAVKTDGSAEEVIAALTIGAVEIFNSAEKQFGRDLAGQMLATFLRLLLDHLNAMPDICPESAAAAEKSDEEEKGSEIQWIT